MCPGRRQREAPASGAQHLVLCHFGVARGVTLVSLGRLRPAHRPGTPVCLAPLTGGLARVPLPDGTVFKSAGRVDLTQPGIDVFIVPDTGRPLDLAPFCAALS